MLKFVRNEFSSDWRATINQLIYEKVDVNPRNPFRRLGCFISRPHYLITELTNACNQRCPQCFRPQMLEDHLAKTGRINYGLMQLDAFKRLVFPLRRTLTGIGLNGFGESLVHPEFISILEYLREVLPRAHAGLHSNGLKLDEEKARAFIRYRINSVSVSLDAATPETYARIRGNQKDFNKVVANIEGFVSIRNSANADLPKINLSYNIHRENIGELSSFLELAHELRVDEATPINLGNPMWGLYGGMANPSPWPNAREEVAREVEKAKDTAERLGLKADLPDLSPRVIGSAGIDPQPGFSCAWPIAVAPYVTWEGYLLLCCWVPDPSTYNLGNVWETPLSKLWNSGRLRKVRAATAKGKLFNICEGCQPVGGVYTIPELIDLPV